MCICDVAHLEVYECSSARVWLRLYVCAYACAYERLLACTWVRVCEYVSTYICLGGGNVYVSRCSVYMHCSLCAREFACVSVGVYRCVCTCVRACVCVQVFMFACGCYAYMGFVSACMQ